MQLLKEGKEEHSPQTPYKEKSKKPTTTKTTTRAREEFVKPTVDEVAAHIREKGYTFDAKRKKYFADRRKLLNFFAP